MYFCSAYLVIYSVCAGEDKLQELVFCRVFRLSSKCLCPLSRFAGPLVPFIVAFSLLGCILLRQSSKAIE